MLLRGTPAHPPHPPGQAMVLAGSVHVSSSCWVITMFTAELQLHVFPFQLLCLEYSPQNTPDELSCCWRD